MLTVEALDGTRSAGRVARLLWREASGRVAPPALSPARGPGVRRGRIFARPEGRGRGGRRHPGPTAGPRRRAVRPAPRDCGHHCCRRTPPPPPPGRVCSAICCPGRGCRRRPGRNARAGRLPPGNRQATRSWTTVSRPWSYPLRRRLGLGLGLRAAWALAGLAVRFGRLRRLWREHARELASPEAWRRRAGPPRKNGPEARPPAEES